MTCIYTQLFLGKWKLASRAAISTISASIGGALFAVIYSCKLNKKYQKKLNVALFTSGMLGGMVGITAICTLCRPWEAYIIGIIGGALSCIGKLKILSCILIFIKKIQASIRTNTKMKTQTSQSTFHLIIYDEIFIYFYVVILLLLITEAFSAQQFCKCY